jgi:DNA excision repair protein ERCC-8
MNHLLLDRSIGSIGPDAFARWQTTRLVNATQPDPSLRFHDEKARDVDYGSGSEGFSQTTPSLYWAHQAGINALCIDPFESRL